MKRSQGPRSRTEVSHIKEAEQRLKICEDYTFCKNGMASVYGILMAFYSQFSDKKKRRTNDAAYYSKFLEDRVKSAFRSNRRGRSVKSVCLLHDNARPHTAAVTKGTLEKCIGRYCHTPPIVLTCHEANFTCSIHSKRP